MENMKLYVLSKEGTTINPMTVMALAEHTEKMVGKFPGLGFGSAYNMTAYLLDAIEDHADTSIVVAWDMEGDLPHPRCLVGEEEIRELINALEAEPDGDSWEIIRRVNLRIRNAE